MLIFIYNTLEAEQVLASLKLAKEQPFFVCIEKDPFSYKECDRDYNLKTAPSLILSVEYLTLGNKFCLYLSLFCIILR